MAKDWKPGLHEGFGRDSRLWDIEGAVSTVHLYRLRIGWREIYISRGEILLVLFVGMFAGFLFAAGQAGYLRLPDRTPALAPYDAPEPRLLGSTEATVPEAGDPDYHFVNRRGRLVAPRPRPAEPVEIAAPAAEEIRVPALDCLAPCSTPEAASSAADGASPS